MGTNKHLLEANSVGGCFFFFLPGKILNGDESASRVSRNHVVIVPQGLNGFSEEMRVVWSMGGKTNKETTRE